MATQLSGTDYANRTKNLLGLVNQLRALGAQSDLDLPRITVIGNQSAGKSSVVEAISGINVPRDAGTCTRCPMECRLASSSGPWSCTVSIRREFDNAGKPLTEVSEVRFGDIIRNKSEVELALRRAQLAILNPQMSHAKILSSTIEQLKELSAQSSKSLPFSRNVICVDLEGPELTDLSFIDLPGLIQNAEPEVVQLVEDLVVSHIKGECLILVALPMTDDIENQKALRLAHQVDPEGRRTIGVMTKPDMLISGSTKSLEIWLDVIEGRRHPLAHGYYCTRQPNDAERGEDITSGHARSLEASFFRDTPPWSKSSHSQRFGTENLVAALSRLLVQVINATLPKIRAKAAMGLESCRRELSGIPKAIKEKPATHMLSLITAFSSDVQAYVRGGSETSRLIHDNRGAYGALKIAIRRTAPDFLPFLPTEPRGDFVNSLDDGEEDLLTDDCAKPFNLLDMRRHINKSITRELPDNVPFDAKVVLILNFQNTWEGVVEQCLDRVKDITLDVLMECIDAKFVRYELLRSQLRTVVSELVEKHYETCLSILQAILETETSPFTQNTHYLGACKEKWLAKYKSVRLGESKFSELDHVRWPPNKRLKLSGDRSYSPEAEMSEVGGDDGELGDEDEPLQENEEDDGDDDEEDDDDDEEEESDGGEEVGGIAPVKSSYQENPLKRSRDISEIIAELAARTGIPISLEDIPKLKPSDEYETELKVMAEVRGYFQVAYKRVIDVIPSLIDLKFVRAISREIQAFLISHFELGEGDAGERCARYYLAEDPAVVSRRDGLLAKQKMLVNVQKQLKEFGVPTRGGVV